MLTKIYYLHKGNDVPFYIGKFSKKSRLSSHKKKFGKDIQLVIIDEVPIKEWKFWEIHYISLYKSWGFKLENKNNGGGGPTYMSDDIKILMSDKMRNNKERGIKIGNANRGRISPMKGKTQTEEWKRNMSVLISNNLDRNNKISDSHKSKSKEDKQIIIGKIIKGNSIPINQYDLEGNFIQEWDSAKHASRELKLLDSNINCCLKGKYKQSGGFKWKYKM